MIFRFVEGDPNSPARSSDAPASAFSKLWIGDRVPRKIDALSLMSMSDAFFGRVFHARRELVPFGTVSLTTYFHADAEDLAAEDITPRSRRRRRQDLSQELWRSEPGTLVTAGPPARDHGIRLRISRRSRIQSAVRSSLESRTRPCPKLANRKPRAVALLGVPIEIGASQRGTLMGPDALRTAGIGRVLEQLGFDVEDHGNLRVSARCIRRWSAAGKRQILRRHQSLDPRAQRTRLSARPLRRDSDLHGRRSQPVDGIGERRRALLAGNGPAAFRAVARRPRRLQHAGHHRDRQHARHVGGVSMRRARPRWLAGRRAAGLDQS